MHVHMPIIITYKYTYLISTVMNPTNTVFWSYAVKGSFSEQISIVYRNVHNDSTGQNE